MSFLHFHRGRKAVTVETLPKDFRRRAKRALDDATWAVLQSEEAAYRAKEAVARCECAEAKASTAYACSLEAVQILAAEVREAVEGRPVSAIVFDEFLRQAAEEVKAEHGRCEIEEPAFLCRKRGASQSAAEALGVRLPRDEKAVRP